LERLGSSTFYLRRTHKKKKKKKKKKGQCPQCPIIFSVGLVIVSK